YSLPSFDGIAAFHIKQKKSPDIPFIIVSGTIGEENVVELLKLGATDYVFKDLGRLALTVRRALEEVAQQRERKRAEEELTNSETRYRRLFESAKDGILILDAETGKIVDVNPFLIELLGFSKEQFIEKEIWEIGFFKDVVTNYNKFIELQQKKYVRYEDLPLETTDGRKINVEFVSNVYLVNHQKVIQCNIRDITERKRVEEKYRSIFENAVVGIYQSKTDGQYVSANPKLALILGYASPDELMASVTDISHQFYVDSNRREEFIRLIGEQSTVLGFESQVYRKDGSVIWVSETGRGIRDTDGDTIGFEGITIDITDRKQAEEKLQESEERFRITAKNLTDVIYDWDIKENIDWYGDIDGITGYPPGGFPRTLKAWAAIVHPEDRDCVMTALEDQVKGVASYFVEYRIGRKDGEWRWWSARGTALRNDLGEPYKMIGSVTDITDRKQAEDALRDAEARYRALFDQSPNGILLVDLETGKTIEANETASKQLGYTHEEFTALRISDYEVSDTPEEIAKRTQKIIREGSDDFETLHRTKSGEIRNVHMWIKTLHLGERSFFHAVLQDITARKQAEKEIAMLAHSLKSVNEFVSITDMEDNILFVNESFLKTYGYSENELIGKNMTIARSPNNLPELTKEILPATIRGGWQGELWNKRKDGSEFPIYLSTTIINDKEGKPLGLIGIAQDITERKRTEKAMREHAEQYSTILSATLFGFMLTDEKGKLLDVNDAYCGMTGYTKEELLNLSVTDIEAIDKPEEVAKRIQKIIESGTDHFESKHKAKDGRVFDVEISMGFLYSKKQIIVFIRDITDRKLAEQELIKAKEKAEESDRLKSAFLANMSHEIRTPMNGILGFADLLKEPNLTGEKQLKYIKIIERSGARMLNIINNIVDISKIEAGLTEVNLKESNINEQIDYIYTFFKPEVEQKGMQLLFKKSLASKDSVVKTDREKLYAILTNLVKNAIKYTNKGFIEFGYHLKTDSKTAELEFFVKDTGIGIPKDRQKAIFERFIQADISDKMAYQGAGLGLSISKAYVEMLGGKMWVNSEEGNLPAGKARDTTFYFTLPYNTEPEEKIVAENVIPADGARNHVNPEVSGLKILIAEDDEPSGMLITIALKMFSKEVLKVVTGVEAVEACRNNPDIDLILMDIRMPEMNGYEATRQIRQFNKDVVIIAQTAFALPGDREKAIEAGCNDYISKPFSQTVFTELMEKYFNKERIN
ncbi:MAG: PAS domain S-box protein, partial [Lutibacter sp.]